MFHLRLHTAEPPPEGAPPSRPTVSEPQGPGKKKPQGPKTLGTRPDSRTEEGGGEESSPEDTEGDLQLRYKTL